MSAELEFHPVADIFPMMSGLEFSGLVDDIKVNGLREPVWLHEDGRIIDGRNRYKACRQLGVEPTIRIYGGLDDTLHEFVVSLNLHRRHLDETQRGFVGEAIARYCEAAQIRVTIAEAAELVNVSERTINSARFVREHGTAELVAEAERGRKEGGLSVSAAAAAAQLDAEKQRLFLEHSRQEKTARIARQMRRDEFEDREMVARLSSQDWQPDLDRDPHVGANSGENEWYTPVEYILAARTVMGGIDLDPASSRTANGTVAADRYFTEQDNGLAQFWTGRIWMNPPYAQPLVSQFCEKLAKSYSGGEGKVTEACALVNNATETGWFQTLAEAASAICFPRGRVKFWHPSREAVPLQGQAVLYLGPNAEGFQAEFGKFGFVATL